MIITCPIIDSALITRICPILFPHYMAIFVVYLKVTFVGTLLTNAYLTKALLINVTLTS